jgi:hypothetical protein
MKLGIGFLFALSLLGLGRSTEATYADSDLSTMLDRVKQTGATHITIPYFGCQTSITSNDVGACSVGSQEQTVRVAKLALSKNFGVTFLPIVVTPQWDWRGTFVPTDINAWFASYNTWLTSLAQIANGLGLKEFIVGSELSQIYEYQSQWSTFLKNFRGVFKGNLIVAVNWSKIDYSFWAQADAIGISTYFPVSNSNHPTQNNIDAGMLANKNAILAVSKKWNLPVDFVEFGFPSTEVAAKSPWQALASDGVDPTLQEECFDSFRRTWGNEKALVRASVWATGDLNDPNYSFSFETLGKPAEVPLTGFFSDRQKL